jgi:protein-S-isoprenylcysteine O-methyltransferase Ste14
LGDKLWAFAGRACTAAMHVVRARAHAAQSSRANPRRLGVSAADPATARARGWHRCCRADSEHRALAGRFAVLNIQSPKGLSPTGVGPLLMLGQLLLVALAIGAARQWPSSAGTPAPLLRAAGIVWLGFGLLTWALTLRRFLREFPTGELIVSGPYRWSRNPLYASMLVFVIPGLALITGMWTLLPAALGGVALCYVLVKKEERELERVFGADWRAYRARTSWLFPWPPKAGAKGTAQTAF